MRTISMLSLGLVLFTGTALAGDELVTNGSFEQPLIPAGLSWDIFPGTVPFDLAEGQIRTTTAGGWTIVQTTGNIGASGYRLGIELQRIWTPADGSQYAELDPYDPVNISQTLATCSGASYQVDYSWSPRPGVADNRMRVSFGGWSTTHTASGTGFSDTDWTAETNTVTATSAATVLQFEEYGPDDQLGMFLDAVSVIGPSVCVDIDIKPGSYPNCFNLNGHGVVPVAILGSATFDVTEIDLNGLVFGSLQVRMKKNGTSQCHFEDVSGDFSFSAEGAPDGFLDLVCQFEDDGSWTTASGVGEITGMLLDGRTFFGFDSICVVP